jgi:hypothetical protein
MRYREINSIKGIRIFKVQQSNVQCIEKIINSTTDFQKRSGHNEVLANPNDMIQCQKSNKCITTLEIDSIDDIIILDELIRKRLEHKYFTTLKILARVMRCPSSHHVQFLA